MSVVGNSKFVDRRLVALAIVVIGTIAAVIIRWEGQPWWCECSSYAFGTWDAWSSHTSQHLIDPYSLTHISHGFFLWWLLARWSTRLGKGVATVTATAAESLWEVVENSPLVIDRYRTATAALGYSGDSVANSIGDIACCVFGYLLARYLGWRWSVALFIACEILLVVWIRDSLLLNVIMLLFSSDSLRQWQLGHP